MRNGLRMVPLRSVALVAALALSAPVLALDCTFVSFKGAFANPSNWSCQSVPGPADIARISSGNVTLSSSATVAQLIVSGGVISINDQLSLTVNSSATLSGGTFISPGLGTVELVPAANSFIEGGSPLTFNSVVLRNFGTLRWNANDISLVGLVAQIANHGSTLLTGIGSRRLTSSQIGNAAFVNFGAASLLNISAGAELQMGFGIEGIDNDGEIRIGTGSTLLANDPFTVLGGTVVLLQRGLVRAPGGFGIRQAGLVGAADARILGDFVVEDSILSPRGLRVSGNFRMLPDATLDFAFMGAVAGDGRSPTAVLGRELTVDFRAELAGTIRVIQNGGYVAPADGQLLLTAGSRIGTFGITNNSVIGSQVVITGNKVYLARSTPTFAISSASVREGDSGTRALRFGVSLLPPLVSASSVRFDTLNGSAIAPGDYLSVTGLTVSFNANETFKFVDVLVNGDTTQEPLENFVGQLSNSSGPTIGIASEQGFIENDDGGSPCTWISSGDDSWDNPSAWGGCALGGGNVTGTPGPLDGAIIGNTGGAAFINQATVVKSLLLQEGVIDGASQLTVSANFRWAGGDLRGPRNSKLVLSAGASAELDSPSATMHLFGRDLEVFGNVLAVQGILFIAPDSAVEIRPSGQLDVDGSLPFEIAGFGAVTNQNRFRKLGGSTFTVISAPFLNYGVAEFLAGIARIDGYVQFGTTQINGGTLNSNESIVLVDGVLLSAPGVQTIDGSVQNLGAEIRPGGSGGYADLRIQGTYNQLPPASLVMEFNGTNPGVNADRLTVVGVVNLDGTLRLLNPAGYNPPPASTYPLMVFESTFGSMFAMVNNAFAGTSISYSTLAVNLNGPFGSPTVTVANVTVDEFAGTATITATVTPAPAGPVSVQYQTQNGTATSPADFVAASGTFNFSNLTTTDSFTVTIINDALNENNEVFRVNLFNPTAPLLIGAGNPSTVTITDDDPLPLIGWTGNRSLPEGNVGSTAMGFELALSAPSGRALSVDVQSIAGSASDGKDFVGLSTQTFTFNPGQTNRAVTVLINGDLTQENHENFLLRMSNPVNVVKPGGSADDATGLIINDDGASCTWDGSSGLWSDPSRWISCGGGAGLPLGTPGVSDSALISAGQVTLAGLRPVQVLTLQGGTVQFGDDSLQVLSSLTWTVGQLNGTNLAKLMIAASANAVIGANAGTRSLQSLSLENLGTMQFGGTGSIQLLGNALILNRGALDFNDSVNIVGSGSSSFSNASGATWRKLGSYAQLISGTAVTNAGRFEVRGGSVDFSANPLTQVGAPALTELVSGTTLQFSSFELQGGILEARDASNMAGIVNNTGGTFLIGGTGTYGDVRIQGEYRQGIGASMGLDIGGAVPGVSHDRLRVLASPGTGAVQLAGTVNLFKDAAFTPAFQTFQMLSYASRSGFMGVGTNQLSATHDFFQESTQAVLRARGMPTVTVSPALLNLSEGAGTASFDVTVSANPGASATINYATAMGSASSPSDYISTSGVLTFTPTGATTQTVVVSIIDDALDEDAEDFQFQIGSPVGLTLGSPNASTVTITDNDAQPSVAFAAGPYVINEGNVGTTALSFTINLSVVSGLDVSIPVSSAPIDAMSPSDFTAISQSYTILAGATAVTVPVLINGDTDFEANERFTLNIGTPTNATLGAPSIATGTITNDDAVGAVTCTWNGSIGSWNVASNWLNCAGGSGVPLNTPGPSDSVIINSGTVNALVPATISVRGYEQRGTSIVNDGDITVTNTCEWQSGRQAGGNRIGRFNVAAGAVCNFSANTFAQARVLQNLTLNNLGTINVTGDGFTLMATTSTIVNGSAIAVGIMNFDMPGPDFARINTETFASVAAFNNAALGQINFNSGTELFIGVPFSNAGQFTISDGEVLIIGGGTDSGRFSVGNGAKLRYGSSGSPRTLATAGLIDGLGVLQFLGFSTVVQGLLDTSLVAIPVNSRVAFNRAGGALIKSLELGLVPIRNGRPPEGAVPGEITGTAEVLISNRLDWYDGTATSTSGAPKLIIGASAVANLLPGFNGFRSLERPLEIAGSLTWSDLDIHLLPAANIEILAGGSMQIIHESLVATLTMRCPTCTGTQPNFINRGVLHKLGLGDALINSTVIFQQRGALGLIGGKLQIANFTQSDTPARTTLMGGTLGNGGGLSLTFNAGELAGASSTTSFLEGPVVNNGANFLPGGSGAPGSLRIVGNYTQTIAGRSSFDLGGGLVTTEFDQLQATGSVILGAGTVINTQQINGFTTPAPGQTFTLLSGLTRTGTATLGSSAFAAYVLDFATPTAVIYGLPPQPTLSVANAARAEGNSGTSAMNFVATLSGLSVNPVTFNVTTAAVTATAGSDYVSVTGQLITIPPNTLTFNIPVQINGDAIFEIDETFTLTISNVVGANYLATGPNVGTIQNDDAAPQISIDSLSVIEGNSGFSNALISVRRTGNSQVGSTVQFSTEAGSATTPSDFEAASATLSFSATETLKFAIVRIVGDTVAEPDETFRVRLVSPVNAAVVGTGLADIMIVNDDAESVRLSICGARTEEGVGAYVATLVRTGVNPISVTYFTSAISATPGQDYTPVSATVSWLANDVGTKTISVPILDDLLIEGPEEFVLALDKVSPGGVLIAPSTQLIRIGDNDERIFGDDLETPACL